MTTIYDVLKALAKYDGSPNAHDMVIADNGVGVGRSGGKVTVEIAIIVLIGLLFGTLGCAIHDHNKHYSNLFK